MDQSGGRYESEIDTVLSDPTIDVVDVCLPPHLHFEVSQAALKAGKHVICEKPLTTSLQDVDRLNDLVRETGFNVFPVFQYRYGRAISQTKALIESGLTGQLFAGSLETHWNRGADYYAAEWRGTWAGEQGGAVLCHAIHIHDLLSDLCGPVERVYAETATRVNDIETEDCAALSIKLKNGAVITSSISLGAAYDTSRIRLLFENVTIESGRAPYAPGQFDWTFLARDPDFQPQVDNCVDAVEEEVEGYAGFFHEVHRALNSEPDNAVSLSDGHQSIDFVSAVYLSSRSGRPIELPTDSTSEVYLGWTP